MKICAPNAPDNNHRYQYAFIANATLRVPKSCSPESSPKKTGMGDSFVACRLFSAIQSAAAEFQGLGLCGLNFAHLQHSLRARLSTREACAGS